MEVRTLESATNPKGDAWIVIEQEGAPVIISVTVKKAGSAPFHTRGIHSPELAIKASVAWADLLSIDNVYVRTAVGREW